MSAHTPIDLTCEAGSKNTPALSDYDGASERWVETEFLADAAPHNLMAGTWEGEPGWVRFDSWPYTEICVIQSGRVSVEDYDGRTWSYAAGDAFLIPAGFRGIWRTLEPTRKVFVGVPG